jgi:hypothetical protein
MEICEKEPGQSVVGDVHGKLLAGPFRGISMRSALAKELTKYFHVAAHFLETDWRPEGG